MNANQLCVCTGARIDRARSFLNPLEAAMEEFGITSRLSKAAFLANVGHESGGLHWLTELWGPTDAQSRYEGRKDLGNTQIGDGYKFRGRGLLQTTGRSNYERTGAALGMDLTTYPELLAEPVAAARSAAWFWAEHGLSALADANRFQDVVRRINGGNNGMADREALYAAALEIVE